MYLTNDEIRMTNGRNGHWSFVLRHSDLYASLFQLNVQCQTTDLVAEHLKAGWCAGFERVLAFDHRFINLGAAFDVVALHGEQLLQDVRGAIGLQRPDFHFAEPLTAKPRLAA